MGINVTRRMEIQLLLIYAFRTKFMIPHDLPFRNVHAHLDSKPDAARFPGHYVTHLINNTNTIAFAPAARGKYGPWKE